MRNRNDICILKHHARISFEIIFLILVSMNEEMCEKALTRVNYSKIIQLDINSGDVIFLILSLPFMTKVVYLVICCFLGKFL